MWEVLECKKQRVILNTEKDLSSEVLETSKGRSFVTSFLRMTRKMIYGPYFRNSHLKKRNSRYSSKTQPDAARKPTTP